MHFLPLEALRSHYPKLYLDYVNRRTHILAPPSLERTIETARQVSRPLPGAVVTRWREYLSRLGAPPAIHEGLERLARGAAAVVTGQQPGLFGGPAYVLYKALTAIALARAVDPIVPCVPVFWNHSDDHNLSEFFRVWLPAEGGIREFHLEVGDAPVPAYLWDGSLPDPPVGLGPVRPHLREDYARGAAEGFSRVLLRYLGGHGLVPVEPRVLEGEETRAVYNKALGDPEQVRKLLRTGIQAVRDAGYATVLGGLGGCGVFRIRARRREKIEWDGNRLLVGGRVVEVEAIRNESRLSPQVFLRPIVQDAVLPTCAYVAGPHEVAYLAELGPLYPHFGVHRPVIVPRLGATVLDARASRALEKLAMEPARAIGPEEAAFAAVARASRVEVERLTAFRREILTGFEGLIPGIRELDPSLESALRRTEGKLQSILEAFEQKIVQALRRTESSRIERLRTFRELVLPGGVLQERRLGWIALLAWGGMDLPGRLLDNLDPFESRHMLVDLRRKVRKGSP